MAPAGDGDDATAATERDPTTVPHLVLLMRHAKMARDPTPPPTEDPRPARLASPGDVSGIGRALAETLHRGRQGYDTLVVRHEDTVEARSTAATVVRAYEDARTAEAWEHAPPVDGPTAVERDWTSPSPYAPAALAEDWLDDTVGRRLVVDRPTDREPIDAGRRTAILLVGHDPPMTWLLTRVLGRTSRWQRARHYFSPPVPALAHTEVVACETTGYRPAAAARRIAVWSLSPTDEASESALIAKIKSKMDTAKVFAGVLTAVATFAANNLPGAAGADRNVAVGGLALLGLSIVLYLVTMFWYDALLLPKRFWGGGPPNDSTSTWLSRPPSSSTWVLFQNMVVVWSRVFVPATVVAGAGVALYVVGRAGTTETNWPVVAAGFVGAALVAVVIGASGRPRLGAHD
jgi:hypothetical protein